MEINKSNWDLVDYYLEKENPTWDESFLHEDEVENISEINAVSDEKIRNKLELNYSDAENSVKNSFPPHTNPLTEEYEDLELKYMRDSIGDFMLYPGQFHLIIGKPETLKTWMMLSLISHHDIRYFDWENSGRVMKKRLKDMNIPVDKAGVFCFAPTVDEVNSRTDEYAVTKPDVVCYDGLADLIAVYGKDGDNNADVVEVLTKTVLRLKHAGIATVALEHLPKSSTDHNDDFPIGAQAKKAKADVIFLLRARKDSHIIDIYVVKDRHNSIYERVGEVGAFKRYGTLELKMENNALRVVISPNFICLIEGEEVPISDSNKMEAICQVIAENPGISKTKVEKAVGGNHGHNKELIDFLERKNYIGIERKNNGHYLKLNKVFKPERKPKGLFSNGFQA